MNSVFISHSSEDDDFVRKLRAELASHGQDGWIDSRELRGGDPLWSEIQKAIERASAYAVVISTDALQSKWVGKELRHALEVQRGHGKDEFPVIPLSLDDTKLGVLEEFFDEEPIYIPVTSDAGGVEAAMNSILVAVGGRKPADVPATPQPKAEPLEELVLELTDLKFQEQDGVRRASARARLVYEPDTPGQPDVHSAQQWRLVAPMGPIEAEELSWYLEKYAVWPSGIDVIRERARQVEASLQEWGRLLHQAAMPVEHTANVMEAWARIGDRAGRRFSVHVDTALEAGAPEAEVETAREAANLLLGLPWELLHDGEGYLFQGAKPYRVRRRLPGTKGFDVPVVATPIRILLVTARPEDEACGYIDHRVSALPLVEAMEALPGLVEIQVLSPPSLPALSEELERARKAERPYQVVHFDGHGVYDRSVGLGGICFEDPGDADRLEERRHLTVYTDELGPLLRDHRIPLVFLDACQTAVAEQASESVASELLKVGVASVVAMSHRVLVETTRRFVAAFYGELAQGTRVGDAMLAGQRALKDDTARGRVFGERELRLEDWLVPVLFQEKNDPQLFTMAPAQQTREDFQEALAARLGELPPKPETGFIGRSRELLALQRLLRPESGGRYAVIRGQRGEGKTALAAEFARWMVRSHQIRRAAFVSVESHSYQQAVVDALGRQLVGKRYLGGGVLDKAIQAVESALREQPTLVVMDNMESVLQPPYMLHETPEALSKEARAELETILALCAQWLKVGETRLVFTSCEPLPAPFEAERSRRELHRLDREDATKLVERALDVAGGGPGVPDEAAREEIEQLVDAVHGHARTLALLGPDLRSRGVAAIRASLVELMADMEKRFPGNRERSVYASVEISLQRLSAANRERVGVLGVFYGGVCTNFLTYMMDWKQAEVDSLASELVETGLATANSWNYLTLSSALCPYLREQMGTSECEALKSRWAHCMRTWILGLYEDSVENTERAATLAALDLHNFFATLEHFRQAGDMAETINLASALHFLLRNAGKARLLERLAGIRDSAAKALGTAWSHASYEAAADRIENLSNAGKSSEVVNDAKSLLNDAKTAGEQAYDCADYDLARAYWLLATVLSGTGSPEGSERVLSLINEARQRFQSIVDARQSKAAERMLSLCFEVEGNLFLRMQQLDSAAMAFEERKRGALQLGDERGVAVAEGSLGTVNLLWGDYPEALEAFGRARRWYEDLNEPSKVAHYWSLIGVVHAKMDDERKAEDAYRKSLAISVRTRDPSTTATTLTRLGDLYAEVIGRREDAVASYKQAIYEFVKLRNTDGERHARLNLSNVLLELGRNNDARQELTQIIKSEDRLNHLAFASDNLSKIEASEGDTDAAEKTTRKAIHFYLDFRRQGGEEYLAECHLASHLTEHLMNMEAQAAETLLKDNRTDYEEVGFGNYIDALQAIVSGSRDRALTDDPELRYTMAAEILLLIETLENAGR